MKSITLATSLLVLFFLFNIVSCEKQVASKKEAEMKITENPLNIVGVKHNEIVLSNLRSYKQGEMVSFIQKIAPQLQEDKDLQVYATSKSFDVDKIIELADKYNNFRFKIS